MIKICASYLTPFCKHVSKVDNSGPTGNMQNGKKADKHKIEHKLEKQSQILKTDLSIRQITSSSVIFLAKFIVCVLNL